MLPPFKTTDDVVKPLTQAACSLSANPRSTFGFRSPSEFFASSLDLAFVVIVCFTITIKIWESSTLYVFILTAAVVYAGAAALIRVPQRPVIQFSWMDAALFAVVLVECISYAKSTYRPNSLTSFSEVIFLFLFYCLVRAGLWRDFQQMAIFAFLSLLGLWISSRALYSFYLHYHRFNALGFTDITNFKHLFGLVGSDGYSTGERITTLLLLLPFPLMLFVRFRNHRARWLLLIPVITIIAALLATFSRAVYFSVAAFFVITDLLFWRFQLSRVKTILLANSIVLLAVMIILAPALKSVASTASIISTKSQARSIEGRVDTWRNSLDLVRKHPLFGIGAYNFPMRYNFYSRDHQAFVPNSYDFFFQILLERGILGLVAYFAMLVIFFWVCFQKIKKGDIGAFQTAIVTLSLAAVSAAIVRDITFSSLLINKGASTLLWFSFASAINAAGGKVARPAGVPQVGITVSLGNAVTDGYRLEPARIIDHGEKMAPRAIYISSVLIAALGMAYTLQAARGREVAGSKFAGFASQIAIGQYLEAKANIDAALKLWPDNAYYRSCQGLVEERLATPTADPSPLDQRPIITANDRQLLHAAAQAYEAAMASNPDDDCFYHNLGWLYWQLGQESEAVDSFKHAIALNGAIGLYHVSLGMCYERSANSSAAAEYSMALRLSPGLLDSGFFHDLERRQPALVDRIISDAISDLESRLASSGHPIIESQLGRLYIGRDLARAHDLLVRSTAALPSLSRAWTNLGNVLMLEGNKDEAELCFRRAVLLDASDYLPQVALARLYEDQGKPNDAIGCYLKAIDVHRQLISVHAFRSARIYNSQIVVRDDIVPTGLLDYTEPWFDRTGAYASLAVLYSQLGDSAKASYYQQLGQRPMQ